MHAPHKFVEKGLSWAANGLWYALQPLYRIAPNASFTPAWSDRPLLKSNEKFRPPLGVPRETTSLCPTCTREARQCITDGKATPDLFIQEHAAEIPAQIIERDGKVLMVKDCPTHGHFEDVLSTDPVFFKKMEEMFQGTDIPIHSTDGMHNHGLSALRYGRGTVLTVDLTNRCNMMCDPCFTDANQVGFVHEPEWEEIKAILDRAAAVKPKRQMSVQFSGGEPTLSPYFIKAVAYCKELGFNSTQAATNGIEFAKDPEFCRKAAEAGLRFVYLQFDGVGNAANQHRRVANLFDVKLRAIENLHANGVDIVLVSTIINGVNNEQVGRIVEFALDNPKKISFISFQPVSFTGRDEEISDERRAAQRYTIADLAHDIKRQTGISEPHRDWFPISMMTTFGDWADLVHGSSAAFGHLNCGCHPDCGSGMAVMIDKETKERVPVSAFLDGHNLVKDLAVINDAARGRFLSVLGMAVSLLRNYDPFTVAEAAEDHRPAAEVRQGVRGHQARLRQGGQGPHAGRRAEAPLGQLALPVHRRHVVPGPVDVRLPPHAPVHHPLRHAGGRDLLLRLQHRGGLAADRREAPPDGDARAVVRPEGPPPHLHRRPPRAAGHDRAHARAEPGGAGRRRAARPRSRGRRQDLARGEDQGAPHRARALSPGARD